MKNLSNRVPNLPPEQQAIRDRCFHPTGIFFEFKKEEIEQSIPDRFEKQVRQYPQRLAIKTRSAELTYDELNQVANRIAWAILGRIFFGFGESRYLYLTILMPDEFQPYSNHSFLLGNREGRAGVLPQLLHFMGLCILIKK